MDSEIRKAKIMQAIVGSKTPITATVLAKEMGVSRQIIVGDVAILRARGQDIIATARGYIVPESMKNGRYIGKFVSKHDAENTKEELYTIVDRGGKILDVIVDHDLYGEISGQLNLCTREDVDNFIQKAHSSGAKFLSELKKGVHLHTISCENKESFDKIIDALTLRSYIYVDKT